MARVHRVAGAWSVSDGPVTERATSVTLRDCLFVTDAARRSAATPKQPTEHAWIEGEPGTVERGQDWLEVRFSASGEHAFTIAGGSPVSSAPAVVMDGLGRVWVPPDTITPWQPSPSSP